MLGFHAAKHSRLVPPRLRAAATDLREAGRLMETGSCLAAVRFVVSGARHLGLAQAHYDSIEPGTAGKRLERGLETLHGRLRSITSAYERRCRYGGRWV